MVCLHPLRLQQVEEPTFWFAVKTLYRCKTFAGGRHRFRVVATEGEHAFAGDDLKQVCRLGAGRASARTYPTAIQSDRQRTIRNGEMVPHGLFSALHLGQQSTGLDQKRSIYNFDGTRSRGKGLPSGQRTGKTGT